MSEKLLEQYVIFHIGKEIYALNSAYVLRIENDKKVRHVPNVKEEIRGIITVEEDIVPLVDLRIKFKIKSSHEDDIPYIIVCKIEEQGIVVGFIVDDVKEVLDIPADADLGNISESITGNATEYIQGIYRPNREKEKEEGNKSNKKEELLYIILNVNKLLGLETVDELKDMKENK